MPKIALGDRRIRVQWLACRAVSASAEVCSRLCDDSGNVQFLLLFVRPDDDVQPISAECYRTSAFFLGLELKRLLFGSPYCACVTKRNIRFTTMMCRIKYASSAVQCRDQNNLSTPSVSIQLKTETHQRTCLPNNVFSCVCVCVCVCACCMCVSDLSKN